MTFDKGLGVEADVSVTAAAIAFVYVCNEWRRVNALCHRRAIKAKMNFIGNNCEAPPPNFIGTSFVCGIDGQAEASWKRASSFRRLPLTLSLPPPPHSFDPLKSTQFPGNRSINNIACHKVAIKPSAIRQRNGNYHKRKRKCIRTHTHNANTYTHTYQRRLTT